MIINENITIEQITKSPYDFAKIITEKFCGDKWEKDLKEHDTELLYKILKKLEETEINYRQFNEILLLLNQTQWEVTFSNSFLKKNVLILKL